MLNMIVPESTTTKHLIILGIRKLRELAESQSTKIIFFGKLTGQNISILRVKQNLRGYF